MIQGDLQAPNWLDLQRLHHNPLGRSVQPLLHRVEDGFVLPSLDAPFFGRRVLRFHIADRRGQLGDFPKGPAFVLAPVERVRPEGLQ